MKTVRGEIGWMEERNLVDSETYDGFQRLAADSARPAVQAHATTRAILNIHISPGRETDHLFQLPESSKVEVLKRETAEKPHLKINPALPRTEKTVTKKASGKTEEPPIPMEDWLLIRSQASRRWVLARMVDLDVPLEIAQYSRASGLSPISCSTK